MAYYCTLPNTKIRRTPKLSLTTHHQVLSINPLRGVYPVQTRELWESTHHKHHHDRQRKEIDKYVRFCQSRQRLRPAHHPHNPRKLDNEFHPWRAPGWGWGSHEKDPWEAQRIRIQERLERIKKEIEADPYAALFGRRLEPFGSRIKPDSTFTSLWRHIFGLDKGSGSAGAMKVRTQTFSSVNMQPQKRKSQEVQPQPVQTSKTLDFEFDPISGRMVPKPSTSPYQAEEPHTNGTGSLSSQDETHKPTSKRPGYMAPVGEPTTHSPTTKPVNVEDGSISENFGGAVSHETEDVPSRIEKTSGDTFVLPVATSETPKDSSPLTEDSFNVIRAGPPRPNEEAGFLTQSKVNDSHRTNEHEPLQESQSNIAIPEVPTDVKYDEPSSERRGFLARDEDAPAKREQAQQSRAREDEEAELGGLRASDIRATYTSKHIDRDPEMQKRPSGYSDHSIEPFKDPLSDIYSSGLHKPIDGVNLPDSNGESSPSIRPRESELLASASEQQDQNRDMESPPPHEPSTEVYRILAFDPSSLQITEAQTTSSSHATNEGLHPTEILSRLNNPAKFLPYFGQMHADGYEIVSGGGDILVFRKTFQPNSFKPSQMRNQDTKQAKPSPSPPDAINPKVPLGDSSTNGASSNESSLRKVLRRMLFTGVATAAACYAIGVVGEYFRTGGQEGLGIDGFTEFESERRHRERV